LKVLVWGAGPVGLFLGATLARSGSDVVFWGRPSVLAPLQGGFAWQQHGLVQRVGPLAAVYSAEQALAAGPFDAVLVTFKAWHNATAQEAIAALAGFPLLVLQNGIGNEESFARLAPVVWSGVLTSSAYWQEAGCLHVGRGGLGLAVGPGERSQQQASGLQALGQTWRQAGLPVRFYPDYRAMKWSKLLLNNLGNPLSAALGLPPRQYLQSAPGVWLERTLLAEMLALVRTQGLPLVNLPGFPVRVLPLLRRFPASLWRKLVGGGRGGKLPSLLLDRQAGRPLDREVLLEIPARLGRQQGLSLPLLERLGQILATGSFVTPDQLFQEMQQARPPR